MEYSTTLITDTAHYTTVLDLAMKAKHSLWIGIADIKFVGDSAQRCAFCEMVRCMGKRRGNDFQESYFKFYRKI